MVYDTTLLLVAKHIIELEISGVHVLGEPIHSDLGFMDPDRGVGRRDAVEGVILELLPEHGALPHAYAYPHVRGLLVFLTLILREPVLYKHGRVAQVTVSTISTVHHTIVFLHLWIVLVLVHFALIAHVVSLVQFFDDITLLR